MNVKHLSACLFVFGAIGCAQQGSGGSGNENLGIDHFDTVETASTVKVTGVNANGVVVATMELTHGRFTLSGAFTEDYNTPDVDGRKLVVDAFDRQLEWQTAGYEPTYHLPPHPADAWRLGEFLDDPHVKATLDRWQIGFDGPGSSVDGEDAYGISGWYRGDHAANCDGMSSCGSTSNGVINTCGGGAAALQARTAIQHVGDQCGLYTGLYNQVLMEQCCPAGSGGQSTRWFAQKACPTTTNNSTTCGTRTTGACKACPTYPVAAGYECILQTYDQGLCNGIMVSHLMYSAYNTCETCQPTCRAGQQWCGEYCAPIGGC